MTGEQRGATTRASLDHLPEIAPFAVSNRGEAPVHPKVGQPRRRLVRATPQPLAVRSAINQVGSKDFMHDQLRDARNVRLFNVIDDRTREGLTIDAELSDNPQQDAYVERFNRTVRCDWLAQHILEALRRCKRPQGAGSGHTTTNDPIWH